MTLKDRIIKILTDMAYVLPKVPYQTPFVDQLAEAIIAEVEKPTGFEVVEKCAEWIYKKVNEKK